MEFDAKNTLKRLKKIETHSSKHFGKFILRRAGSVAHVRRQVASWLLMVGFTMGALGLQLLWYQQAYVVQAPSEGGTYAEGIIGSLGTLNPIYAATEPELAAAKLMFSSLYTYDESGYLKGDLATSVQLGESGREYTVVLREDAKWHDGKPVTAADVAFTINLIKDPNARASNSSVWQGIESRPLGKNSFYFRLPAVSAPFMHSLTFPILPEHILKGIDPSLLRESTYSRSPVGSGPFMFRGFQFEYGGSDKDHQLLQMAANDNYYGGKPRLSRFEIHSYNKPDQLVSAVKRSEVNAASGLSDSLLKDVGNIVQASSHPSYSGVYAIFNNARPALKEKPVREALRLASDLTAIRKQLGESGKPLDLPILGDMFNGHDLPKAPGYDIKRAAKILDESGWVLKDGVRQKENTRLMLKVTTVKEDNYEKVLEMLASNWRQIGVEVNASAVDISSPASNFSRDVLQPRDYDVLVNELFIGADPDVYAFWHSSQRNPNGRNLANYKNDLVDDLLTSARSRTETDLRRAKYIAFADQWLKDVPAVGIYQPVVSYTTKPQVLSVSKNMVRVAPAERYGNVVNWSVRQQSVYKTP